MSDDDARAGRRRCVDSLLAIDVDALEDAELLGYVYAMRKALAWCADGVGGPRPKARMTSPERVLAEEEIEGVKRAVEDCGWNLAAAAQRLGISARTARWRLSKYADPAWRARYVTMAARNKGRSTGRPPKAKPTTTATTAAAMPVVDRDLDEAHALMDLERRRGANG